MSNILHLTLKKKWFDMILSGEKTEEYREIKPYWDKRLFLKDLFMLPRRFDFIRFTNGYGKNKPSLDIKLEVIYRGMGKTRWGAEAKEIYYVLKLGEILSKRNITEAK